MAKEYRHPISGCIYTVNAQGLVNVHDPKTGQNGVFDSRGVWFEGEIRDVDMQALGWVGRSPEARAIREATS
jgi:hypothetical protein